MQFQIVSVAVVLMALAAIGSAQAMGFGPMGPMGPMGPSFCQIQSNILLTEAAKINTPDLPADLKLRLDTVLENSAKECSACEGMIIWQSKMCAVTVMRTNLLQLQQIKAEADARLATTIAPAK